MVDICSDAFRRKISHFQKKSFWHLKNASLRQYPSFPLQLKIHCQKMENTFPPMQWRKHIFHGDVKRYQNIYELILVVLDQNVKHIEFIPSHRRSFFYLVDTASDFLHHKFNFYQNERIIDFTTSSWDIEIATWEKICTNYHQLSSYYCSCSENDLNFGISLILAYQSEIF